MGALRSTDEGSPAVVTMAPLGGSDECFSLGSPRSIEACRRRGLEDSDLEERSEESFFRHEQPQQRRRDPSKSRSPAAAREWPTEGYAKADAVIRRERHEINRHRLLREVSTLYIGLSWLSPPETPLAVWVSLRAFSLIRAT